jgi:hypothetical protein
MPKLSVETQSKLSAKEAFEKVTKLLEHDSDLKKLDSSYSCQFDPASLTGVASGKLFKAKMEIQDQGDGSKVTIIVDLPMTLALAKGMVQKTLQKKLDVSLS